MQRNNKVFGLASILGGVLGIGGCFEGQFNNAPEIKIAELNGNTLNPSFVGKVSPEDECDVIYDLPVPRGDFLEEEFRLSVRVNDNDGPEPLRVANYPMTIIQKEDGSITHDESDLAVGSYLGRHEIDKVTYNVLVTPRDNEVSLGRHRLVISASDGIAANEQNYCFNFDVFAGDTVPPGEMPQTPTDNGNGNNMECYSNADCMTNEICEDNICVPHNPEPSKLEDKILAHACETITRPSGNAIDLYITKNAASSHPTYHKVAKLDANSPEGSQTHYSFSIPTGEFAIVVERKNVEGVLQNVFRIKPYNNSSAKLSSSVGYFSDSCPSVGIYSSDTPDQVFTITSQ